MPKGNACPLKGIPICRPFLCLIYCSVLDDSGLASKALSSSSVPSFPPQYPYLDVRALTSLVLTVGPHTAMHLIKSLKGISFPEKEKRFTDAEKAVLECCLSHLIWSRCACNSWVQSQFCVVQQHVEERRQAEFFALTPMRLYTTQWWTSDCSREKFKYLATQL